MGIVQRIKNRIAQETMEAAQKGADTLTKLSELSPKQVEEIAKLREAYLTEKPSPDDQLAQELTMRNLGAIGVEVFQAYLPQISSLYLPVNEENDFDTKNLIRYFDINKWVNDVDENNNEKLINVYQVLSEEECNIALIYDRKKSGCKVSIAVVNNTTEGDPTEVDTYKKRLLGALAGNFPGAEFVLSGSKGYGVGTPSCLQNIKNASVAMVSNLATEKSEKFISQSMDKLLDGIVPQTDEQEYRIVLLATPVKEQSLRKARLCELYTSLAPYSGWETNFTYSETNGVNSQATFGINVGGSAGVQAGVNASTGTSKQHTDSKDSNKSVSFGIPILSGTVGKGKGWADSTGTSTQQGFNAGGHAGVNFGMNFARSSSITATIGKNEGISQSFVNYNIKHTLEILEQQMKRLEESTALGLWDFAAYVISEDPVIANNVAHTYLALTQGENSFIAQSAVNLWRGDLDESRDINNERGQVAVILRELSQLQHPIFALRENNSKEWLMYPLSITATTSLSGKELAYSLNFPRKSVQGFPVLECAPFGRNISSYRPIMGNLKLGCIYHMHQAEKNSDVFLNGDSLTSHVFVTGSTGTGKSNTVFTIIKKVLKEKKAKFLIIEPAKGEYKNVFGGQEDVQVYGTNPKFAKLLRINPFSFPSNIAVNEHIDRLVEIFNVCWPMYAAMPAILKDAVIRAYEKSGWDLETSENNCSQQLYPGFGDVLEQVRVILNESEYSADSKGDYVGALVARLKSLTDGINGQIFCSNGLSDKELFDENVIIDLSRVGSVDSKALIMGLLVMKLQEYRLSDKAPDRKELEHLTVLEEAHNLLRRTSYEQSSESSNLLGKSVEMLTNAIAELRSFGEGFVIVDQAPGLLDMAVIRNTNTKIIHRLPDSSDRELVGKAVGLNEEQIVELSKLELGVAAVYQNDWVESVLCSVEEYMEEEKKKHVFVPVGSSKKTTKEIKKTIADILMKPNEFIKFDEAEIMNSSLNASAKYRLLQYLSDKADRSIATKAEIAVEVFGNTRMFEQLKLQQDNLADNYILKEELKTIAQYYSEFELQNLIALLLRGQAERNGAFLALYNNYVADINRFGGIK